MAKKQEDGFEKLARLIKEEGEDIRNEIKAELRSEIRGEVRGLERRMDERFTALDRRLNGTLQPQLDEHARRIKTVERKVATLR